VTPDERLSAAIALHQSGQLDQAEEAYLKILEGHPKSADVLKLLGLIELTRGDFDEALSYIEDAVEAAPEVGELWHLLGRIRTEMGDLEVGEADLARAVENNPDDVAGAHLDLALCRARLGNWHGSLDIAEKLLRTEPNNPFAMRAAATALGSLGREKEADAYYQRAVAADPNDAGGWEGLARSARKRGDTFAALNHLDKAVSLEPDNAEYAYMRRVVAAEMVPAWHFNMMNDTVRNTAFQAAIRRQVKPGQIVFEIGAGAGLLAMMAARQGATVISCESNPAIARVARQIVARNQLSERISIVDKGSWELQVGVDLPRPADVLIAEIFSAQLLSEDVLPSLEDAKTRLCRPDAAVIPAVGMMRGALVQSPSLEALTRVGTVEGFDLSPFNTFTPPLMNLDAPNMALGWLSEPVDLFTFDFQGDQHWPSATNEVQVEVSQSGTCQGVVQWLWLAVDDETPYENPPLGPKGLRTPHWTPLLYAFPEPRRLTKGQVVTLHVVHDRKGARVDLVEVS